MKKVTATRLETGKKLKRRLEEIENRATSTNQESVGNEVESGSFEGEGAGGRRLFCSPPGYPPLPVTQRGPIIWHQGYQKRKERDELHCDLFSNLPAHYQAPYAFTYSKSKALQFDYPTPLRRSAADYKLESPVRTSPKYNIFDEGSDGGRQQRHRNTPALIRTGPDWTTLGKLALTTIFCSSAIIPVAAAQHAVPDPILHFALGTSIAASGAIPPLRGNDNISPNY